MTFAAISQHLRVLEDVDIAKESADLILLEKSLLVLEEGILERRMVFANILKYVRMGASSSFGNMFSVVGVSAFLPFMPMAPLHILTNNLLYDFSQVLGSHGIGLAEKKQKLSRSPGPGGSDS